MQCSVKKEKLFERPIGREFFSFSEMELFLAFLSSAVILFCFVFSHLGEKMKTGMKGR
jgi:hypothetical protein